MKYINIKTGSVLETNGKIKGKNWVLDEKSKKQEKPKKRKKDNKSQEKEVEDGELCNN